ncbi:MAG: hypothetical protein OEV44_12190 [Spirochaetota bacterium]|nr:hypothetical protein [Spirochaetota bacterium]
MLQNNANKNVLIDASLLISEACCLSGAYVYIGYPITPTNLIYKYSFQRFPLSLAAPDEITTLQWMAGFSAAGKFPVTASSFPGLALMIESINMAFMMELPLLIILSQRLGPSTGSATTGAQGDLLLLRGLISGGYSIPVLCPSNFEDCWLLTNRSIKTAMELRTPVVLLTSKEMIMTQRNFNLSTLSAIAPISNNLYESNETYLPYKAENNQPPDFLPLGNDMHQVRLNASTHDESGLIRKTTPNAMRNTKRLHDKIVNRISEYTYYKYYHQDKSNKLIVTYGITSDAARDAVQILKSTGKNISLLIVNTLIPVPSKIKEIINSYSKIIFAEENLTGLFIELLYGHQIPQNVRGVNKLGKMITPHDIIAIANSF